MPLLVYKNRKLMQQKLKIAREQVILLEKALENTSEPAPMPCSCLQKNARPCSVGSNGYQPGNPRDGDLSFFDLAGIGLFEWDAASGNIHTSPGWDMYFGPGVQKISNPLMGLLPYIDSSYRHSAATDFADFFAKKASYKKISVLKSGSGQWVDLTLLAEFSNNGELQRLACTAVDVTEIKNNELARKKEKEFIALSTIGFPDLTVIVDTNYVILETSPAVLHYAGVGPTALANESLMSLFLGASQKILIQNLVKVIETNIPTEFNTTLFFPNGRRLSSTIQLWPQLFFQQNTNTVCIDIWDTGSSSRAAESFHTLFNSMVDGFIIVQYPSLLANGHNDRTCTEKLTIIAINPALARMYHTKPEAVSGKPLEVFAGNDMEQWAICLQQVITHGKPVIYCMKSKEHSLLLELSSFISGMGNIACIVKDVTSAQATEESIILNEARLSALYRLAYMSYSAPIETTMTYTLSQTIQLTGSEIGAILFYDMSSKNYEIWSQSSSDGMVRKNLNEEELEKEGLGGDVVMELTPAIVNAVPENSPRFAPDGIPIVRYMIAPVFEDDEIICIGRVANKPSDYEPADLRQLELFLTGAWMHLRRRWTHERLEKAKELAEVASQAKDMFLANVSHELRTPLNGILGMLQLLLQSPLNSEQIDWVQIALDSGRGLLRIISDILNIARIEAKQTEVTAKAFHLPSSIQSTLSIFFHKAEQRKIAFNITIDDNIPEALIGDVALLRQIILNIVGNAFKFTQTGSIDFECSVLHQSQNDNVTLYMAVHDTGIGMTEKQLVNVFKPFIQFDYSAKRQFGGVGLGLSIVHRLINVMDGSLCIDSSLGEGTSLYISLPVKKGTVDDLPTDCPTAIYASHSSLLILIAEDDPVNQFTIKTMLQKLGHQVFCVTNGFDALVALRLQQFDCLITDIQMPGMDGQELISRIRNENIPPIDPSHVLFDKLPIRPEAKPCYFDPHIPIIILSAHVMPDKKNHLARSSNSIFLEKPIDLHSLITVLNSIAFQHEADFPY